MQRVQCTVSIGGLRSDTELVGLAGSPESVAGQISPVITCLSFITHHVVNAVSSIRMFT